jgi:TatD DNase family protein
MKLIDSHCHLDFEAFDHDRDEVLQHCQQLGVTDIIVPGVTAETWDRLITVCQHTEKLHPALGLHPMFMAEHKTEHLALLSDYVENYKPIAIGEIGLDFYLDDHDKQSRLDLFEAQLIIARDANLPVILHVRKAHDQTLSLLKKYQITKGIVHAFSGSQQQAQLYIKQGFLLGIGGALTYDRAIKLRGLFTTLPISSVVLETDSPDMPLANMGSNRNSPENIPKILKTLAKLRNETPEYLASETTHNVSSLFW